MLKNVANKHIIFTYFVQQQQQQQKNVWRLCFQGTFKIGFT